jgi:hypothetical protein
MGTNTKGNAPAAAKTAHASRSDKKVECYPMLNAELIEQLVAVAAQIGQTKTAFAAKLAHFCLWNHTALDQLRPYFQFAVALNWNEDEQRNVFHVWMPDREGYRDIRPVIGEEREQQGQRFKFRITQEDRRRLQVLAYALNISKVDSLWPVLFPLMLLDGRSLYNITQSRDVAVRGFHPLRQEWLEIRSWDNEKVKA